MMRLPRHPTRRFLRDQRGSATVEIVILLPMLFSLFGMAFELGLLNVREMMLSRATDLTVREVRLGDGATPTFENFQHAICERAMIIPNCENAIRIEMRSLPPEDWADIAGDARCVNAEEAINPANEFVHGEENELMLIRVCALFDPIFPTSGLGFRLPKNSDGQYGLQVSSAFVNEPES